ncbi:hypothetical protein MRX96_029555 [Rhipicephalus microplus]
MMTPTFPGTSLGVVLRFFGISPCEHKGSRTDVERRDLTLRAQMCENGCRISVGATLPTITFFPLHGEENEEFWKVRWSTFEGKPLPPLFAGSNTGDDSHLQLGPQSFGA